MCNNINAKSHFREKEFKAHMESVGIIVTPCDKTFYLSDKKRYTPDFFIPSINTYVEVIGSRQAHNANIDKYVEMIRELPANILIITHNLSELHPEKFKAMTRYSNHDDCYIPMCNKKSKVHGLCDRHYAYERRIPYSELMSRDELASAIVSLIASLPGKSNGRPLKEKVRCKIENCDRHSISLGMCSKHYQYQRIANKSGRIVHSFERRKVSLSSKIRMERYANEKAGRAATVPEATSGSNSTS